MRVVGGGGGGVGIRLTQPLPLLLPHSQGSLVD